MMDGTSISQDYALECFDYKDGVLFWKMRPLHHFIDEWRQKIFNTKQAGKPAGTVVGGYLLINLKIGPIGAHRAIFLMHHGYLPPEVDHINGDPLDNRLVNLRAATHAQNLRNMKTSAANTSGIKGVYWNKATGKWSASIRDGGKFKHLGFFVNKDDAAKARKSAEIAVYGEFANER